MTLFSYPDCHDVSGRFYANADPTLNADYTKDQMWENNMGWDDADSVLVPFGYKVTLFDQDGFWGDEEEIKGKPYEDAHDEMICQNLGDLKNRAASIRVGRTTVLGPAVGYWEGVTHSEDITVTYHIGFDYSKSVED